MALELPEPLREKARVVGQQAWVDGLPGLIAELEHDWEIGVGTPYGGGTEAYVARATDGDGSPAVLKLVLPQQDSARNEIVALELADGDGCPRLLRSDRDRGALLLERLGRPLVELGVPPLRRHELLCTAAVRIWRPAPDCGLPTGAEKAQHLAAYIPTTWEELGRPCSERAVEHALACAERRRAAHDDERAVLVHGDVHQWNALEAGDGFKLVDPDGLLAEPEYDLGIIMREDPLEPDLPTRAERLAALTGCNAAAIRDWGDVERVATGLLATRIGLQPVGREMLAAAEAMSSANGAGL